jgi:carbonic anhydrase
MSNASAPAPVNVTYAPAAFPALEPFFAGNHQFATDKNASDANYFPTLAEGQAPPLVWIGCADSRVPESVVLHQDPGQVFTTVSARARPPRPHHSG